MTSNITIVGIGRLGLCVGLVFEKAGHNVLGVDVNPEYVLAINDKTLQSYEPAVESMLKRSQNLRATLSLTEGVDHSDIIYIYIDTPTKADNMYDTSKLDCLFSLLNTAKIANKHLVIGCTVMPGYTDSAKKLLSDCLDVTLSYHPEFIAQGDIVSGLQNPDLLLIGSSSHEASERIRKIAFSSVHKEWFPKVHCVTPVEAEICKISINGFITMKIAYANLIGDLCCQLNASPEQVLTTVGSDSRIGYKYFSYGYSFGGPCFPRDTVALGNVIAGNKLPNELVTAIGTTNEKHVSFQAAKLEEQHDLVITEDYPFVFTNVTYKENCQVPIIEHSAKLKIAKILAGEGRIVTIRDHQHIIALVKKEYGDIFTYEILE